jgi:hypothetical protein
LVQHERESWSLSSDATGEWLAQGLSAIAPTVILVVLKTGVAVLLEFSGGMDTDKRAPGWAKLR